MKKIFRFSAPLVALAVIATTFVASAYGKGTRGLGTITGTVRDNRGLPLAGAVIQLIRQGNKVVKETYSAADGSFSAKIPAGRYSLKAMANGFPVSAVVGRRDLMQVFDEIFFSFTFGGEVLSLAAAKATIGKLREGTVIPHLWAQGRKLQDGYNALATAAGLAERTRCIGLPPRTVLTFTDRQGRDSLAMKSLFQQEVIRRGILNAGGFNLCYRHSDADIERTLHACRPALAVLADALAADDVEGRLHGPVIQPVFRRA